jgi:hypothetical protein
MTDIETEYKVTLDEWYNKIIVITQTENGKTNTVVLSIKELDIIHNCAQIDLTEK